MNLELTEISPGTWALMIPASSRDEAELFRERVVANMARSGGSAGPPKLANGSSSRVRLSPLVDYMEAAKLSSESCYMFVVLGAVRDGVMTYEPNGGKPGFRWSGLTELAAMFPGRVSKSSLSKAATVLINELPELIGPRLDVDEAFARLDVWLRDHRVTELYEKYRQPRHDL